MDELLEQAYALRKEVSKHYNPQDLYRALEVIQLKRIADVLETAIAETEGNT